MGLSQGIQLWVQDQIKDCGLGLDLGLNHLLLTLSVPVLSL